MYLGAALIGVLAAAVAIPVSRSVRDRAAARASRRTRSPIIDPGSNRVVARRPGRRAAVLGRRGQGAVWVANVDDRTMSRIDPATRHGRGQHSAGGDANRVGVWERVGLDRERPARHGVALRPGRQCRVRRRFGCRGPLEPGGDRLRRRVRVVRLGTGTFARIDPRREAVVGSGIAGNSPSGIACRETATSGSRIRATTPSRR